jgi:hypothetical protein
MSNNDATIPYDGQRGSRNCTVNDPALVAGLAAQKDERAEAVREYAAHSKKKNGKGQRNLKHVISEETFKDGLDSKVKTTTTTKRRNN